MLLLGDCNHWLKEIKDESIDLICTDPPYGIEFMAKHWDKALVPTETWKECFRVLKQGKLAFIMCSPRQDVLSRMIVNLQDAGFRTNYTSIYWTFASGFPKAANVSKLIDKRNGKPRRLTALEFYLSGKIKKKYQSHYKLAEEMNIAESLIRHWIGKCGNQYLLPTVKHWNILKWKLNLDNRYDEEIEREEAKREIIGNRKTKDFSWHDGSMMSKENTIDYSTKTTEIDITKPATEEAKKMEGAYVGFQPKPAVEVILVVSKGKTLTWLDSCRIPYNIETDEQPRIRQDKTITRQETHGYSGHLGKIEDATYFNEKGRFPANLLVSDDVLNDGKIHSSGKFEDYHLTDSNLRNTYGQFKGQNHKISYGDSGSYSRYFDLDAWWSKTFPFIITPKASKSERNKGLDSLEQVKVNDGRNTPIDNPFQRGETLRTNSHPTVKPLKLMSYLITMGSREGDLVLDPFCGSGTVCIAAHQLHRKWLGIEMNPEYAEIIKKRLADPLAQLKLTVFD